uniref:Uncharacterized protein n=1 Tax=viral metagenome TaxID=1070528 RepID=A0A6C0JKB5_9ZZZZ
MKNYFIKLVNNLIKEPPKLLGRWKLDSCNVVLNNKVDLSNEDHCGPCGQYSMQKNEEMINDKKKISFSKKQKDI